MAPARAHNRACFLLASACMCQCHVRLSRRCSIDPPFDLCVRANDCKCTWSCAARQRTSWTQAEPFTAQTVEAQNPPALLSKRLCTRHRRGGASRGVQNMHARFRTRRLSSLYKIVTTRWILLLVCLVVLCCWHSPRDFLCRLIPQKCRND